MRSGKGYIPVDSMFPHMGLNTTKPSSQLSPAFSPNCLNCEVADGLLKKRAGYSLLGGLANVGATDTVMAVAQFQDAAGNQHFVAITTKKQYSYSGNVWTDVSGGISWSGTESNSVNWVVITGTDSGKVLIITNGLDVPRQWTGTGNFSNVTFNYPNFVTCGNFASVGGYLIMADITNSISGRASQNIAWSAAGKVNEWLDGNSGAGEQTLYDVRGSIVALVPLNDQISVYGTNSIHQMIYVAGQLIFSFQKIIENTQLLSGHSIVNLGLYHIFMNLDNFQLYDGSRRLITSADSIHTSYRALIQPNYLSRAFAFLDAAKRRAYFCVPLDAVNVQFYYLEYDLNAINMWKWTPHILNDRPVSVGLYTPNNSIQWNDASIAGLSWATIIQTWGAGNKTGLPVPVITGTLGKVFLFDGTAITDNGTNIAGQWDTIDFTVPQEYESELARWIELEFEAFGDSVDIYYSPNEGNNYFLLKSNLILTNLSTTYRVYLDAVSRTMRFSFTNVRNNSFQVRWARPWLTPSGAY